MKEYALVTGASSGIGLEYARQLAAQGWNVIIVSNKDEENRKAAEELKSTYGVQALPVFLDLTDDGAADFLFDYVRQNGLEVEILINNAGMLLFNQLDRTNPARLDTIVKLHCLTPTKLCRLFAPVMKEKGHGYILIMSSITAWTPFPTISHYAATKAYLKSFGQSLWYEMKDFGVGVTTVFPSAVDTPLYDLDPKFRKKLRAFGVMQSAESLARRGLKSMFGRKRKCVPGLLTKLEAVGCWILPSWICSLVFKLPVIKKILSRI